MRFSLVLEPHAPFPPLKDLSFENRKKIIFNTERLSLRFAIFEAFTLPALAGQSDPDFTFGILTSSLLPDQYKKRLHASVAAHANIHVLEYSSALRFDDICNQAKSKLLGDEHEIYASFRVDDDDVLAQNYISRLRVFLNQGNCGYAIGFRAGSEVTLGSPHLFRPRVRPRHSIGLASIHCRSMASTPKFQTIYGAGAHRRIDETMPMIIDTTPEMYVRLFHGTNLSGNNYDHGNLTRIGTQEMAVIERTAPHMTVDALGRFGVF